MAGHLAGDQPVEQHPPLDPHRHHGPEAGEGVGHDADRTALSQAPAISAGTRATGSTATAPGGMTAGSWAGGSRSSGGSAGELMFIPQMSPLSCVRWGRIVGAIGLAATAFTYQGPQRLQLRPELVHSRKLPAKAWIR
jgi:hypothetical protein